MGYYRSQFNMEEINDEPFPSRPHYPIRAVIWPAQLIAHHQLPSTADA